ncbi:uncharacterized protein LOC125176116 isoform X2 [Prionailurus viverrinus]|uniref:uncharacterized protein LOC125176116 isoform X2 n=1 Tax=Prionailurus viverrinus TaxID=61388 RepID=UPI001FF18F97|nr:uncharacterized protein LOC125176116 isoform X2 [Prionailurus viverrinus]
MAVAAKPPALPTAARRSARPRPGRQLTGPGRGGAPVRPRPRPGPARLGRRAPLDTGHVPAGAARNLQPRWGEKGLELKKPGTWIPMSMDKKAPAKACSL